MKQVLQELRTGETSVADVPPPQVKGGHVLIRTRASVISAGTERTVVEFGRSSLVQKARKQPERVRQVLDKARTDGIVTTYQAVSNRLDQPVELGYCNAGVVIDIGRGVKGFKVGDRVVSNGHHAEVVCVPQNLCARIPDNVSDEAAAFTVLGSIALQGVRLASPTLGESFVVLGLGLLGALTVQLLRASGCRVIGTDINPARLELARRFGADVIDLSAPEDPVGAALSWSQGRGVDGVLLTVATQSSDPVRQAAQMCRKRGRIVLVGVAGLELSRDDFYQKELTFQVSCSYGPGRYDPEYEQKGHDYPLGFVRWTEQRNFEAILQMLEAGSLDVASLVSHRFDIGQASEAYDVLAGGSSCLGILLEYPGSIETEATRAWENRVFLGAEHTAGTTRPQEPVIGLIGAGGYASQVLAPALKQTGAVLKSVASAGGTNAAILGRKFGFEVATSDVSSVLDDPEINAVVIATRHDSHADLTHAALMAGKHVFVEKPLALNSEELDRLEKAYGNSRNLEHPPLVMIGFNRRFAPYVKKVHALIKDVREPKHLTMTVNAGVLPANHWTQDPDIGGGRIIGEGCHFIDLLRFLSGAPIKAVNVLGMRDLSGQEAPVDTVSFMLRFANGSVGVVHYLANGHRSFPKERLDVFCAGQVMHLDNFRELRGFGTPGFRRSKLWRQDKGNAECVSAFINAIRAGAPSPIPFPEISEVTRVSFEIAGAL